MEQALLHFHAALRSMLTRPTPNGEIRYPVTRQASIKDVIEALGPPHTEVARLEANGASVAFSYRLAGNDVVDIYPATLPVDVGQPTRLRPFPLKKLRFLADANVGKLARLLRLAGFDTSFAATAPDPEIAETAAAEERIVLSRDRNLLKRSRIVYGKWIRENPPRAQFQNVLHTYGLWDKIRPFTRCIVCNGELRPIAKDAVLDRLQPLTKKYYENFSICTTCGKVYWAGSHYAAMQHLLRRIKSEPGSGAA